MNNEIEAELYKKYPALFSSRLDRTSPMIFGCEHGDGWANLIRAMCSSLSGQEGVTFSQIKEKFGTLRVYRNGPGGDFADGVIRMAEDMSRYVCEVCGNPGKTRGKGWLSTLCDRCEKKSISNLERESLETAMALLRPEDYPSHKSAHDSIRSLLERLSPPAGTDDG